MAKGIPVFASEWSPSDASEMMSLDFNAGNTWVDWMDTNKVSWANWSASADSDDDTDGKGNTSISNKKFLNDFDKFVYDVVLKNPDSENTSKYVAGIENIYINGGDQYNGGYKWDPYIAMGLNLTKDTTEFKDFANCNSWI